MPDLYKYKIFCETEGLFVYSWGESEPTTCPNNNTHTVTAGSATIVQAVKDTRQYHVFL